MKTAISLPDATFKAAERLAKQLRMSRSELYRLAIEGLLKDRSDAEISANLEEAYGKDPKNADALMMKLQARALPPPEDW